jgi:hypothetical protein
MAIFIEQHPIHGSKKKELFFMQKGTQLSQEFSGGHITPTRAKIDAGDASLLMGI